VIDHATAALGPGLNLLTGETGAGKSILVDALALLLGGKASTDMVRHGAEKAVISCVFESTEEADCILKAHGVDAGDGEILLRREITASSKGRVFVNNQPATAAVLKLLAPELALIHAQSETLAGFDGTQQRLLIDRFAGILRGLFNPLIITFKRSTSSIEDRVCTRAAYRLLLERACVPRFLVIVTRTFSWIGAALRQRNMR